MFFEDEGWGEISRKMYFEIEVIISNNGIVLSFL